MKYIKSNNAPEPIGPYSQAIELNDLIFTSGQIAINPSNSEIISDNIKEQTRQVIQNLQAVLKAADSDLSKVVKTTVFLSNMDNFLEFNEIYSEYFNQSKPARSTVEVNRLPKNVLVEIDCIAVK